MFFGHLLDSHVGADNYTAEVGRKSSESVYGGFQVFFMSTKIDEGHYLVAIGDYFPPVLVLILIEPLREHLFALLGEAKDLLSDGAGPSRLLFMEIVEDPHSGASIAVVSYSLGEH